MTLPSNFRALKSAVSLKQVLVDFVTGAVGSFPRLKKRGLIEAFKNR